MAVTTLVLGGVLVAPHSPSATPSAVPGCVELAEDHVSAVLPDGSETKATDSDGLGRRHYFRTLEGGLITQVTPPSSFDPKTASAQQLETFGYPERPAASTTARAKWDTVWGAKPTLASQSTGYCEAPGFGPAPATPVGTFTAASTAATPACSGSTQGVLGGYTSCYAPSYAGAMATGATFTQANMGWRQTGFVTQPSTICPNTAYVTWTGFGGFKGRLMQAGTIAGAQAPGTSDYLHSRMFWEVISPTVPAPPLYEFSGQNALVSGGDDVRAYVAYNTSGHAGQAIFTVRDVTTNTTRSTGWNDGIIPVGGGALIPFSQFYDGSQAMFFTELPPSPTASFSLRKPALGTTLVTLTNANGQSLTNFRGVQVANAIQVGGSQRPIQDSGFTNGGTSWSTTFRNCR